MSGKPCMLPQRCPKIPSPAAHDFVHLPVKLYPKPSFGEFGNPFSIFWRLRRHKKIPNYRSLNGGVFVRHGRFVRQEEGEGPEMTGNGLLAVQRHFVTQKTRPCVFFLKQRKISQNVSSLCSARRQEFSTPNDTRT